MPKPNVAWPSSPHINPSPPYNSTPISAPQTSNQSNSNMRKASLQRRLNVSTVTEYQNHNTQPSRPNKHPRHSQRPISPYGSSNNFRPSTAPLANFPVQISPITKGPQRQFSRASEVSSTPDPAKLFQTSRPMSSSHSYHLHKAMSSSSKIIILPHTSPSLPMEANPSKRTRASGNPFAPGSRSGYNPKEQVRINIRGKSSLFFH